MKIKANKKYSNVGKNKQLLRIFVIVGIALICVGIIVAIVFGVKYLNMMAKYKTYTDKMYKYGLADLYNNKEANITENVTNEEMLKIVLAAVRGKIELNDYTGSGTNKWLEFSTTRGYNVNITENNLQENANNLETALIAIRALESIQKANIEKTELKMKKTELAKLTSDEQNLLQKAVNIDIIQNNNSTLKKVPMIKGELNKLAVTIIEKFATVYHGTKDGVNIVTDKNKMPSNYEKYPYIVDSIPKDIYEYEFDVMTESTSQVPLETYKDMGDLYGQIEDTLINYYNEILNVDYTTISIQKFMDSIQGRLVYSLEEADVKTYVEYVIKNQIKLSGKAEPLLPIIYNNGEQYLVRTKLTFEVLNSKTEDNLLFGDEGQNIKYTGKQIEMYVDVPMGMTLNSKSLRVYKTCLARQMINNNSSVQIGK